MSSHEIADLVESRHDNVKRTIERLAERGLVRFTPMEETSHEGAGARPVDVYRVGKRDSYVIVAQLSPEFTARLVDRWQKLEEELSASRLAIPGFSDPAATAMNIGLCACRRVPVAVAGVFFVVEKLSQKGGSQWQQSQRCSPNPIPRIPARRRSAPTVRFISFEILATGVRALE